MTPEQTSGAADRRRPRRVDGGRIVVGVDGSDSSLDALRWAHDEARLRGATLEAVLAWTFPYVTPVPGHFADPKWLETEAVGNLEALLRDQLGEEPGVGVARHVEEGPAARVLLDAAQGADLLVVGSRGRGGFAGLVLGSVSQQCASHADCPVVVVRSTNRSGVAGQETRTPIVVGVDGSETSRAALHWALEEARRRRAAVDVIHAWRLP